MKIILAVAYLIVNFLSLKYSLHIFQLNYYMADTQIKWMYKNWKKFLTIFILNILSIIGILETEKIGFEIIILLLIVNIILVIEKNVKKKIVYTKRVIRLFITNYILLALIIALTQNQYKIAMAILLGINSIIPIYTVIINYLNIPINKLINKYYVNDAKRILKSMPNLKIIAVTGSYGKTSMKNYLAKLLSSQYNVLYTPGNFNTLLGITRTIRNDLKPTHEIFICEIGIDRVGQMDKIIELIKPDYAIITAIGEQHLETFKTKENIIKSKLKLLDGLKENGIAFINIDNKSLRESKIEKNHIGYGIENTINEPLKLKKFDYTERGIEFIIEKEEKEYTFNSKLLGEHNLINLYGAITVADYLNVPIKEIINSVKYIQSVEHRLKLIPGTEYNLIDDSYNSNPIGATNALKVLQHMKGYRILITPGMVELGKEQYKYNYEFGKIAGNCADYIILVNKEQTLPIYNALQDCKYPNTQLEVVNTFNIAISKAKQIEKRPKYILIENDLPDNY